MVKREFSIRKFDFQSQKLNFFQIDLVMESFAIFFFLNHFMYKGFLNCQEGENQLLKEISVTNPIRLL